MKCPYRKRCRSDRGSRRVASLIHGAEAGRGQRVEHVHFAAVKMEPAVAPGGDGRRFI